MEIIEEKTFDEERAFYGTSGVTVRRCRFDGPADGESAFKESSDVVAEDSYFNLRYPFWHDRGLTVRRSELTPLCRAAMWYSENISVTDTKLHGIKALRECKDVRLNGCNIISPEFGWSTSNVEMEDCTAESEYFFMRGSDLYLSNVKFQGKYSFQYVENAVVKNCDFHTKDAFWHAKNVTVKDSILQGEYLAWYAENLKLVRCKIIGTQPLCYCKNLELIDCEMAGTDLSFEKSEVHATVLSHVDSVKNPKSGVIYLKSVGEIILDDPVAQGQVVLGVKPAEEAL